MFGILLMTIGFTAYWLKAIHKKIGVYLAVNWFMY